MKTDKTTQTLINQVVDFYRQYLSCSPEQLDLLALWTLHTHMFLAAPFSPSLNIHSREKQSGKTVCLQLLRLLCDDPWMHTAVAPSLLLRQLTNAEPNHFIGTLLLDDCHATLGSSRMNVKLQGLLTASFQQHGCYTVELKEGDSRVFDDIHVFFPTAFAGHGRLHSSLAERSISIALESKEPVLRCQPKACPEASAEGEPGSSFKPFRFYEAQKSARPLSEALREWGAANDEFFSSIAPYKDDQFPSEFTFRQRDCAEPLLHIADFIGGEWPQRARTALVNAFALAAFEDFYSSKQVLSDLRDAFAAKDNPEWISTADLIEFLHAMDNRQWDQWNKAKPMKPQDLASLLKPFGIHPENHRTSPKTVLKGYDLETLQPSWNRHLNPTKPSSPKPDAKVWPDPVRYQPKEPVLRYQPKEAGSHKPEAVVAAKSQNSPIATQKLPHSSEPRRSTVAANLPNCSKGLPDETLTMANQQLTRSTVAAKSQNSSIATQKLPPSSELPSRSTVAANLPSCSKGLPDEKLAMANQQLTRSAVAADLQNQQTATNPQVEPAVQNPSKGFLNQEQTMRTSNAVAANLQNSKSTFALQPPMPTRLLPGSAVAATLQNRPIWPNAVLRYQPKEPSTQKLEGVPNRPAASNGPWATPTSGKRTLSEKIAALLDRSGRFTT
jgi:hypothetical protein